MANNVRIPRGEKGRKFAEAVLLQDEVLANGEPDDTWVTNPVLRKLREQARNGVGSEPGQLPAAFASHLADRAFGKESEKLAVQSKGRPYEGMSREQIAARMDQLAEAARRGKGEPTTEH